MGDLLGRGGMAEVFAGHSVGDHGFQKPVAIKRLLPELANDEVFVERLIEEAKLLVGMQHGNIVSVLDLAREGDDVFLVMEFVDGPSLRQLFKARGARGLSLGVATYIVQSAAAGLEFAHVRPGGAIIHADISPSNLLLTTSGEVRVADFGIARREGLRQGVVEGKWAYMAPEQARGESLTPRSDVFALGVVLYELLTGQHPFGRAVTANQRDDQMQVIPPRVVKPSVPPGLDAMCMRALAHDPRDRYGRMQQLIDALVEERFANGYREGASDLAQTIREVAPKSDLASPRTMHTERPLTIVTRSLLPDDLAARPSRPPSQPPVRPSTRPPQYPLAVGDPPPRDAFPMQPTMAVETRAMALDPTNELSELARSGEHTAARTIDQLALAQAADIADALLLRQALVQLPPQALAARHGLRGDGTPLPPFVMPHVAVPGDELASVVGGHTMTGHGGGVAVEARNRWTLAVLCAAALIGVAAALAIQLSGTPLDTTAPALVAKPVIARLPDPSPLALAAEPLPDPSPLPSAAEPLPDPSPLPSAAEPLPSAAEPLPSAAEPLPDPSPLPSAAEPLPSAAEPSRSNPIEPVAAPAALTPTLDPALVESAPQPTSSTLQPPVTAVTDPPRPNRLVDAGASPRGSEARASGKRTKDPGKRKVEPGILAVQSMPWSWVTIGGQTKETPDKFYLAPGTYDVTFRTDGGLVKIEQVTVEAGKLKKLTKKL
jgi:serine/threonine protein kinase